MPKSKIKTKGFEFKPFSKKQLMILTWYQDSSPYKDKFMIIADGSIRAGKTVCMLLSFMIWSMANFDQQNFAMCGKTVGSFRRNCLTPLKQMAITIGYEIIEHRSDNYIEIIHGNTVNNYYIFGGRDESSQDLIQGITLAGLMLDEVALMPESFYNQATGRLSVDGARLWLNCNPNSPYHWFYINVLQKIHDKMGLYVHFTMDDNLSLSKETKDRYKTIYGGVWYERYILGLWKTADGLVYDMFNKKLNTISPDRIPYDKAVQWCIGVDYGTGNATVFLLAMKTAEGKIYICKEYYFAGRKEAQAQNDYSAQKTDLEFAEEMKTFIGVNYATTGQNYRAIDILVDPAASSFKLQLIRMHMRAKNANNEVLDGIRNVASYFVMGDLIISTECKNTLKEIGTYAWDEKAQLKGLDEVIKQNDHCMDSLRYLVARMKDKNKISQAAKNIGI